MFEHCCSTNFRFCQSKVHHAPTIKSKTGLAQLPALYEFKQNLGIKIKENQGVIFVEEKLHYIKFNPIEKSLVGKKTFGNLTEINGWIAQGPRARRFLTGLLLGFSGAAQLSNKLFEHCYSINVLSNKTRPAHLIAH